jgi:hypothetical protein
LYALTGGADWQLNTNWLVGEPCTNSWHGISCCVDTHPYLNKGECVSGGGVRTALAEPGTAFPRGCESGNVTGTDADYARCVVTRIDLSSNNLRGGLNASFSSLRGLQVQMQVQLQGGADEQLPARCTTAL